MAFKQPKVPEYRGTEKMETYIHKLTLFLRDFCQEVWNESRLAEKGLAGIRYPVGSVNGKTGDVVLGAGDVGALPAGGTAENAMKLNGKTWAQALDEIYPVGAIYISAGAVSPASLFGGTWEQIKDRFLLAASETYKEGGTGGEAAVTLTKDQIPAHNHTAGTLTGTLNIRGKDDSGLDGNTTSASGVFAAKKWSTSAYRMDRASGTESNVVNGFSFSATPTINNTGGGAAHSNMPPYLAVYMWKRVS